MTHRQWIATAGFLWFLIGVLLTLKGIYWMGEAIESTNSLSFRYQETFGTVHQTATVFTSIALLIGWAKGRFVLFKTVRRVAQRILALQPPIALTQAFSKSYWFLIGGMMALGMGMKAISMPEDVRGCIDLAVGTALLQGSLYYFRMAKATLNLSQ
ncbi:MAG: hypothetical protein HY069_01405 [Chlamydiia bacterium]|nr:hypothetical protein [Chlamydiia bacterium]